MKNLKPKMNKTGLQPVSRPVEQFLRFFQKGIKKGSLSQSKKIPVRAWLRGMLVCSNEGLEYVILVGPPVRRLVLAPLAAYTSTTAYIFPYETIPHTNKDTRTRFWDEKKDVFTVPHKKFIFPYF